MTIQTEGNDQYYHVALFITLVISPRIKPQRVTIQQKSTAKYFDVVLLYSVSTRGSEKVNNGSRRNIR